MRVREPYIRSNAGNPDSGGERIRSLFQPVFYYHKQTTFNSLARGKNRHHMKAYALK
jgi:hypothetical protein